MHTITTKLIDINYFVALLLFHSVPFRSFSFDVHCYSIQHLSTDIRSLLFISVDTLYS